MISCDVNVLIYAHNADDPRHTEYAQWLSSAFNGDRPFGVSSLVMSAFVRITTHPRILNQPMTTAQALDITEQIRAAPAVVPMEPGPRHWPIFAELCRRTDARGNTVPDAYLAALAIEHDSEWHSADRGFSRFPGLRGGHPLEPPPPGAPAQRSR